MWWTASAMQAPPPAYSCLREAEPRGRYPLAVPAMQTPPHCSLYSCPSLVGFGREPYILLKKRLRNELPECPPGRPCQPSKKPRCPTGLIHGVLVATYGVMSDAERDHYSPGKTKEKSTITVLRSELTTELGARAQSRVFHPGIVNRYRVRAKASTVVPWSVLRPGARLLSTISISHHHSGTSHGSTTQPGAKV